MLRLFSLPDRESSGRRCPIIARHARSFPSKRGSFFFGRRWGVSERSNGNPSIPQRAKHRQTALCCEAATTGICGEIRPRVCSGIRSSIIHFSFCHLHFLGKTYKFQGFSRANFPLHEKMRRTKGPRWDKVGSSRMRDSPSSRFTIRRKAECTKCERNDNMGDSLIHNLLIIFKCLLGGYKIDNLSNEYNSIISDKNRCMIKSAVKNSMRCICRNAQEIFDKYRKNTSSYYC